jgi:hypothetical protein
LQLEDIPGRKLAEIRPVFGDCAFLKERLCFDFQEFEFHQFVILREASECGEHLSGFGFAVVVDEPTRREGHE